MAWVNFISGGCLEVFIIYVCMYVFYRYIFASAVVTHNQEFKKIHICVCVSEDEGDKLAFLAQLLPACLLLVIGWHPASAHSKPGTRHCCGCLHKLFGWRRAHPVLDK